MVYTSSTSNQGPDNYWGLPGLILEVNAGDTTILCTKIVMNSKDKDNIDKPAKGDVVTQEEYTKITTQKMEEMRSTGVVEEEVDEIKQS